MEVFGYLAAVFIGLSLGLIGGGGSIVTVPVLVYIFAINPVLATAYSLFIVGTTSIIGSVNYLRKGWVDLRMAVLFGIPSMLAVFLTRKWLLPAIPDTICVQDLICFSKDGLIMGVLALMVLGAAIAMIREPGKRPLPKTENIRLPRWVNAAVIPAEGLAVGALTGLVGAGGGFLIIPALVIIGRLDMKSAVGTSLLIIAAKSLLGFVGDWSNYDIDWPFLFAFTALAIVGVIVGARLAQKIRSQHLKRAFGWFLLLMGAFVMLREFMF